MSELYNKEILRWTTRLTARTSLDEPHATSVQTSRICGSRLTISVCFRGGLISDFAQEVKACALGQASAAIVANGIIGMDRVAFNALRQQFVRMLDTGEADFEPTWSDLALLAPVYEHSARRGSVMLPFDCLEDVFNQYHELGHSA